MNGKNTLKKIEKLGENRNLNIKYNDDFESILKILPLI